VPVRIDHPHVQHRHRVPGQPQPRVERFGQTESIEIARQIEMRAHRERVDAGIGPPGGVERHHLPGDREGRSSTACCTEGPCACRWKPM
jgi:hypothetical protein